MFVPVVYWGLWVVRAQRPVEVDLRGDDQHQPLPQVRPLHRRHLLHHRHQGHHALRPTTAAPGPPSPANLAALHTTDLDIDPVDGATAWVSTGDGGSIAPDGFVTAAVNGVFVTHDHGATWAPAAGLTAQSAAPASTACAWRPRRRRSSTPPPATRCRRSRRRPPLTRRRHQLRDASRSPTCSTASTRTRSRCSPSTRATPTSSGRAPSPSARGHRLGHSPRRCLRSRTAAPPGAEIYKLDAVTEPSGQTRGIDGVAFDIAGASRLRRHAHGPPGRRRPGDATAPTLAPTGTAGADPMRRRARRRRLRLLVAVPARQRRRRQLERRRAELLVGAQLRRHRRPRRLPRRHAGRRPVPVYWYMYGAQLGISFDGGVAGGAGPA